MNTNGTKDIRGFLLYVCPALLCCLAIFYLGTIRTPIIIPQELWSKDKLNHCLAFGVLAFLTERAIRFQFAGARALRVTAMSVAISSVTGALLEAWQSLLPYRTAELLDWVADTLGAVLAGLVGLVWMNWQRRRGA